MVDRLLVDALRRGDRTLLEQRRAADSIDLRGADFRNSDLRLLDLSGLDLLGANFSRTRINQVDFRRAMLARTSFESADVTAVAFDEADASYSSFRNAQIRRAAGATGANDNVTFRHTYLNGSSFESAALDAIDLTSATLYNANFTDALLSGIGVDNATFRHAVFGRTIFRNVDLQRATDLEVTTHAAPSTLGHDTIRASAGNISARFLRGCGLSDYEILVAGLFRQGLGGSELSEALYAVMDAYGVKSIQMQPLFISYSHQDAEFVDVLSTYLSSNGIRHWRDKHGLKAGRLETQIAREISLHPVVLLVLSKNSAQSDWVEWEVSMARDLEKKTGRDVLCPVALDAEWRSSPWPAVLRRQIEDYYIIDFSRWQEPALFNEQWLRLLGGLSLYYAR
jgi:uncharacterized protein YjbI with pentapeptide repeats